MKDQEREIWNKAILSVMRAIMICRHGIPGPYYGDVTDLLIVNNDESWTKRAKIIKNFEDEMFKELEDG